MALGPEKARAAHNTVSPYDEQIILDREGITVGGQRIPGCIVADSQSVIVTKTGIEDHWTLTITLMSGKEPQIDEGIIVTTSQTDDRVMYAVPPAVVPIASADPVREIPYDEMRALLGLPDVSDYVLRRGLEQSWNSLQKSVVSFAEVFVEAFPEIVRSAESFKEVLTAMQPKSTPPMWAVDPARSRRRNQR